jgi:hypothetical protein
MEDKIGPGDKGYLYVPSLRKAPQIGVPYFDTEPRSIPMYDFESNRLIIRDPVWGKCEIGAMEGDEILLELADNALVRRLLNVEQLTLDTLTQTIPATAQFSRFEHLWGSVALIRDMLEKYNPEMDSRSKVILQLRAFVSDLGHTSGSHRGDWMFQNIGGPENQHDNELMHLLEVSGVNEILRKYNIDPSEVVFPSVEDWIERPSPDLCVDRVDYGAREIKRWLNLTAQIEFATRPEAFALNGNDLVMTSYQHALNFAKGFLLLATEHWNEPVHRLLLQLDQELVKRLFTADGPALAANHMDGPDEYHPRDYMYTVDRDITMEMGFRDPFLNAVRPLMEDIALAKRRIFAWERREQLSSFFSEFSDPTEFPDPIEPFGYAKDQSLEIVPGNVHIIQVDDPTDLPDYKKNSASLDIALPTMKMRAVDPLFLDETGKVQRLSEADSNYAQLMKRQAETLSRTYVARVYLNPRVKEKIELGIRENEELWPEAVARPRMDPERFNRLLNEAANLAINGSFVILEGESLYR